MHGTGFHDAAVVGFEAVLSRRHQDVLGAAAQARRSSPCSWVVVELSSEPNCGACSAQNTDSTARD
eukprot:2982467-Amphidinium_carterae.2